MGYIIKGSRDKTKATKKKLLWSIVSGILCLSLAITITVTDPVFALVKYLSRVTNGSLVHQALSKEVDSVHISSYLFNITNADRFTSGEDEKLVVEEVGPFTYQECRSNEDMEIDTEAGVMRYTPKQRVTFLPEESVGDPKDMIVNMPNIAMLAMGSAAKDFGYFAKFGFNMLTTRLNSNATVQMTAYDYLWGYDEPLIQLGNTVLPGWINFDTLGLLDRLYDKKATYRIEVDATTEDKFMIKTVNGLGGLKMWGYEDPERRTRCNSFTDVYEGLAYPPGMNPDRPIRIFRSVLCRFLELDYVGTQMMDYGVEAFSYKISNKSFTDIPDNQCLCKNKCVEGVTDMSACFYGLPIVLSNAHFLDASPTLYERVEGIKPNEEDHGSTFIMDPIIGQVLATKFSVQISVDVGDVGYNSKISKFSNMYVPVVNVKIKQPKVADEVISTLRLVYVYTPYIMLAVRLSLTVVGLLLLLYSARLLHWNYIASRGIGFKTEIVDIKEVLCSEPFMKR